MLQEAVLANEASPARVKNLETLDRLAGVGGGIRARIDNPCRCVEPQAGRCLDDIQHRTAAHAPEIVILRWNALAKRGFEIFPLHLRDHIAVVDGVSDARSCDSTEHDFI